MAGTNARCPPQISDKFLSITAFNRNTRLLIKSFFQDGVDSSIFFLGGSGSGVSFHKHADAWNGVIFGRKRWFLYPPQKTPPGGKIERSQHSRYLAPLWIFYCQEVNFG